MTSKEQENFHDTLCNIIANQRFNFTENGLATYINHPDKTISFSNGNLWPDIVAVNGSNIAKCLGEVETEETINEESVEQWRAFANIGVPLYLYVPFGFGSQTKILANGINIAGFREYQVIGNKVTITNV
ncbi:MAG: hypothetical protein M1355_02350 [Patescibacteria group bacterium]|nr:hypothetical protein [Patescibacteria group bacterium]